MASTLNRWGMRAPDPAGGRVDEILLVTSELLTNAVRASPGHATLHLEGHRDHVLVAVRDDSPAQAVARSAAYGETTGRGLAIVEALSSRWGTTPTAGGVGKVVWSKITVRAPSSLSERCHL